MDVINFPQNNEMEANVSNMERQFDVYVRMVKLTAQLKAETYKAYVEAGFTDEQALELTKG